MIIRSAGGIVVGIFDDETFKLTESESEELTALINNWTANGIDKLEPQTGDLEKGQISGDAWETVQPDDRVFLANLRRQLLIKGFEVQVA